MFLLAFESLALGSWAEDEGVQAQGTSQYFHLYSVY